jgi:sec-independent protein translocase protein TatB
VALLQSDCSKATLLQTRGRPLRLVGSVPLTRSLRRGAAGPYPGPVFESVGWGEILVLIVAGLFILGPERLPSAAAWLGKTSRQVREYATGARDQLRRELGPEFDELRKPLEDLKGLRDFNPRTAVRRTLFDDDPDEPAPVKPNGYAATNGASTGAATPAGLTPATLTPGERPPIDPDAT